MVVCLAVSLIVFALTLSVSSTAKAQISLPSSASVSNLNTVTNAVTNNVNNTVPTANPLEIEKDIEGSDITVVKNTKEELCNIISQKIDQKIIKYEQNHSKHLAYYQKERNDLRTLIGKLENKKIDVSKLKTDLSLFDARIKKLSDDKTAMLSKLKEFESLKCDGLEKLANGALQEVKNLEKVTKEDSRSLAAFRSTVLKDVREIGEQLKNNRR
jgi:hypothetical protein